MMPRSVLRAAFAALLAAAPAGAQQEVAFDRPEMVPGPWKFDNFPYFTVTPNDGFLFIGRAQYGQAADFLDRVSMARRFAVEAGASPSGSRFAALMIDLPRLAPGWRLAADFRLERNNRFGAFAFTGAIPDASAWDQDSDDGYLRARRIRSSARVEVTRQLIGPLSLAVAGSVSGTTWGRLSAVTGDDPDEKDTAGRIALVLDLRDREFDTQKGALIEGGWYTGSFGEGYDGGYAIASGFVNPAFGTVLAVRVGGRSVSAGSPLDARYTVPAWERPFVALGGPATHRALDVGRRAGQGVLFGSVELRQIVIDGGDLFGLYGIAFLDAGRAFDGEKFRITTERLQVGGGIGVAIRVLRANIFNTSVATGPDGVKVMVGSGWMF